MEESKFRKAVKEYKNDNMRFVEWLIGLLIGELVLVISQNMSKPNWIFFIFLSATFISILIGIIIMYVLVSYSDVDLNMAILAKKKKQITKEEFNKELKSRLGKISKWLLIEVQYRKAYALLMVAFLISSLSMMVLTIAEYI